MAEFDGARWTARHANDPPMSVVPRAMLDMFAATLRGATKATLGLPGDIEGLGRLGINWAGGNVNPETVLSTTEDMDKHLPPLYPDYPNTKHVYESIGQFAPVNVVGPAIKTVKAGSNALSDALRVPAATASDVAGRRNALLTLGKGAAIAGTATVAPAAIVRALRTASPEAKLLTEGSTELAAKAASRLSPLQLKIGDALESISNSMGHELPAHFDDILKQTRELHPGMSDEVLGNGIRNMEKIYHQDLAHHLGTGEYGVYKYDGLGWSDLEKRGIKDTEALFKGIFDGKIDPSKLRADILGDHARDLGKGIDEMPYRNLFQDMAGHFDAESAALNMKSPQHAEQYLKDLEEISKHTGNPSSVNPDIRKRMSEWFESEKMRKDAIEHYKQMGDPIPDIHGAAPPPAEGLSSAVMAALLRRDLHVTHATQNQYVRGGLPQELYNASFAISKDRPTDFANHGVLLVPHLPKVDPRTSNTVLTGIDAWTPRRNNAAGRRFEPGTKAEYPRLSSYMDPGEIEALRAEELGQLANRRLVDRFYPIFPQGGRNAEMLGTSQREYPAQLPHLGVPENPELLAQALRRQEKTADMLGTFHSMSMGPRFQSFEHYQNSPYGAKRLDRTLKHSSKLYDNAEQFLLNKYNVEDLSELPGTPRDALNFLARNEANTNSIGDVVKARDLINQLRTTHSAYGELKSFGPMGVNGDNFAAITIPGGAGGPLAKARADALRRGIRPIDVQHEGSVYAPEVVQQMLEAQGR